jgi:hypothetical protein
MQLSNELPTAVDYTNILVNYIEVSADDIPKEIPDHIYPPLILPIVETKNHAKDAAKAKKADMEQPARPVYYGGNVPKYLVDLERDEDSKRLQRAARHVADIPTPPSLPLFLGKSILNGTTPMKDDSSVLNMPNHTVLNHLATSSIKHEVLATCLTTRYKRKVSPANPAPERKANGSKVRDDDHVQANQHRQRLMVRNIRSDSRQPCTLPEVSMIRRGTMVAYGHIDREDKALCGIRRKGWSNDLRRLPSSGEHGRCRHIEVEVEVAKFTWLVRLWHITEWFHTG